MLCDIVENNQHFHINSDEGWVMVCKKISIKRVKKNIKIHRIQIWAFLE
jgi:hypothetical protein